MDFAGPFGVLSKGKVQRYVLVVVDLLTRYPVFLPTTSLKGTAVVAALKHGVYERFGEPLSIICDEGRGLISEVVRRDCELRGIQLSPVAPGNHRANGAAERMVGTLNQRMRI